MNIEQNDAKYDDLQIFLLENIVREIKDELTDKGVNEELIYDITGDLAFGICAILDGSRVMEHQGEAVSPYVTFVKDDSKTDGKIENADETLIINSAGPYMHEMVFGCVDEIYDEEEE